MTCAVAYAAIAVLPLGFALRDAVVVRRLRRDGIRAEGAVVDNLRVDDADGYAWRPGRAYRSVSGMP
ncbi:hypothetical protein [Streptomyces sp. NPDC002187]|uniref:hypothetical protein n=1 Tax=Streptomyces sp. NPDC002187 TaxID=3364637 RepID=UPI0036D13280